MSDLAVTVLGSSGTHPGPLGPCSSYLVRSGDYRLLLDAGHGSLATLHRFCEPADVDAVLVSHRHPDHCADLLGMFYARMFAGEGNPDAEPPVLPVYAPDGVADTVRASIGADAAAAFDKRLAFSTVTAGDDLDLGPFAISLFAADHLVEGVMPRIGAGAATVCYTGDTGPDGQVTDAARGVDLLIADCSWLERTSPRPGGIHMTGGEAGEHAQRAGVGMLAAGHIQPRYPAAEVAAEAAATFDGSVVVARAGETFEL